MNLRDFQTVCCERTLAEFAFHDSVLIVLPTGCGKTEIFVSIANQWQYGRVLVIAPLIQLINQAAEKIRQRTGHMPSIEQAGNWSNESCWARSQFVVGSKQTLFGSSKRYERIRDVGLVIVDESHLQLTAAVKEGLDYFVERGAKVLGVTATAGGPKEKAHKNIYQSCAYQMSIAEAIPQGWLVSPRAHSIQLESLDLSTVGSKKDGDFKDNELAAIMEDDKVVCEIAAVTAAESGNLKTVIYCASVNEARKVANRLKDTYGLPANWICGDTRICDEDRRKHIVKEFTKGGIQFVANVGCLTTGWDFPGLEHIVMARPTRSLSLFTQILGRGTRPLEGVVDFEGSTPESRLAAIAASAKPHFLVTDLRGNTLEHKLISTVDVLAGEMGLDVVQEAKRATEAQSVDVRKALLEAQELVAKRERARLALVEAQAKYQKRTADPFDDNQRAPARKTGRVIRMFYGKHKGEPISAQSTGYLIGFLKTNPKGFFRDAIEFELRKRSRKTTHSATVNGVDVNALFAEASFAEKPSAWDVICAHTV